MNSTNAKQVLTVAVALGLGASASAVELRELSRRAIRESASPMNFCHAQAFPDGMVSLGHSLGVHMVDEAGGGMTSWDRGKTWRLGGEQLGGMNAYVTRDGRKRWLECWASEPKLEHEGTAMTMDRDGKVTKSKFKVTCPTPMAIHFYRDVVRRQDGSLLQCGYFADPRRMSLRRGIKFSTACLLKSEDDGLTWRVLSCLPDCEGAQEGQSESSVVELKDGRLAMFVRVGNGMFPEIGKVGLRRYLSEDGGRTWDRGKEIADYGVEPQAGFLADGTLFVLSGRPGVYLLLDPTGTGDHFERHEIFKGMGSASSTLLELEPGKLSIIYDDSQYSMWAGDNATNRIMMVEYAYKAESWARPKTTRRYLQSPRSERMLVYWREGKITFSETFHEHDWQRTRYYGKETTPPGHGVWLLHGREDEPFDFARAEMKVEADATPIHAQVWRAGDLEFQLEACSPFGRRESAHLRLTVANHGTRTLTHPLAWLVRSATERELVFSGPDLYDIYNPKLRPWLALPKTWQPSGAGVWTDGDRFVAIASELESRWDAQLGAVRLTASVAPGAVQSVDLVIGRGPVEKPDYENARSRTRRDWQRELGRVQDRTQLLRLMAVQMLQCHSAAVGRDYFLPRQGGLQRWVWPGETVQVAAALQLLGYGEYAEETLEFCFGQYSNPSGELGPFGNHWACDTACVLEIFARHCLGSGDRRIWERYRDQAMKAFGWIQAKRHESDGMPDCVAGLFPPMRACDDDTVAQFWCGTDLTNIHAMECFAEAAERFGDPEAKAVRAEAAAYRQVIAALVERHVRAAEGQDSLMLPIDANGVLDAKLRQQGYFYCHPAQFAEMGFLSAKDMLRVRKWLLDHGYANERGLYFRHRSLKSDCGRLVELNDHVWYTSWCEFNWYRAWKRVGQDQLAQAALAATLKYSVTDEGYVGERYNDATPWYFPWSPNASGAARIVRMILDK